MTDGSDHPLAVAADATLAAALFAIDRVGLGGVVVRAGAGPVRDRWLEGARRMLPPSVPWRRVPIGITDERLLGGLDLGATLGAGRVIAQRGILADADSGVIILAMAERLSGATAARLTVAIDRGEVALERDGLALRHTTRFGVIALDEGATADERPPMALSDRLAFHLDLTGLRHGQLADFAIDLAELTRAQARLEAVTITDELIEALCGTALALGIVSLRAAQLAVQAARAHAALEGRETVLQADAEVAGRLVLASRATQLPAPDDQPRSPDPEPPPPDRDDQPPAENDPEDDRDKPLDDVVLAAVLAAIPPNLLAALRNGTTNRAPARTAGKAGAAKRSSRRGRPVGATRGDPRSGARLSVLDTLRAAAPWQTIRKAERTGTGGPRIEIRRDDFRIKRFKMNTETTTIFVVDASGSAALHRLAEAKGAIELLLADCYVRRDNVAMIAFRGTTAELLLPPTRSLVRAKRSLAGLPGGGGTPLATAIDAALLLAQSVARRAETPIVVFLTDGRANICRDGTGGRATAEVEAIAAARQLRTADFSTILVDTAPQPTAVAQKLAHEMGARYLALPYADARMISKAIQSSTRASP